MVDGVEADGRLLDEHAMSHSLEDYAVDAVLVAPVGNHKMRVSARRDDGVLGGRIGHEDHLHPVTALEPSSHRFFVVWAKASHSREHRARHYHCSACASPHDLRA